MTARTRRNGTLKLGTALATTLASFVMGGAAQAQNASDTLPVLSGTQGASFAGTTITSPPAPTPTQLDININDQSRVINWQTYNVASGNTVNYTTTTPGTPYAVLNRVTGTDVGANFFRSMIDGTINSQSNIAIWLTNPAGITYGPTGAFNGGSLVMTTLNIGDTDFLNAAPGNTGFTLSGASANNVVLTAGTGSLTSNGSVILAAQEISTGKNITGSTGVTLVAAQDVTFNSGGFFSF